MIKSIYTTIIRCHITIPSNIYHCYTAKNLLIIGVWNGYVSSNGWCVNGFCLVSVVFLTGQSNITYMFILIKSMYHLSTFVHN